MDKLVYLYELDSARQTDEEIIIGQQAMHDEIVKNGNTVVLTYNQLVDSRGFFSLFNDKVNGEPVYFNNIISLFECGALRLSQYSDVRTVSQYILNALSKNAKFIFSALPIKGNQKRLIALMERALHYSDLSELHSYLESGRRTDEETEALFEYIEGGVPQKSTVEITEMREILGNLYYLLALILRISPMHQIYISPRDTDEYDGIRFCNILDIVLDFPSSGARWDAAVKIIKSIESDGTTLVEAGVNDRSSYLRKMIEMSDNEPERLTEYRYAAAIVHLCYNYACEISIANSSKHYDFNEFLDKDGGMPTFTADFLNRLKRDFCENPIEERYLIRDTNEFNQFENKKSFGKNRIDLSDAVRIAESMSRSKRNIQNEAAQTPQYEHEYSAELKRHTSRVLLNSSKFIILSVLSILFAVFLDFGFNYLENFNILKSENEFLSFIYELISIVIVLIITEAITTLLSKLKFTAHIFMPFSDAIKSIFYAISDSLSVLQLVVFKKSRAYVNKERKSDSAKITEKRNKAVPIKYIIPQRLMSYQRKRYPNLKSKDHTDAIPTLEYYPVAPADTLDAITELLRVEELTDKEYGIVYQSKYNTLVVDPIIHKNGSIYPYERIIPTDGNGVAILTVCDGKFVLICQERHPIRGTQAAFVRGFREPDTTDEENVIRELREELEAEVLKVSSEPIGYMTPDSGLSSARIAIFAAEIAKGYKIKSGYEGIKHTSEYTEREFEELVRSGEIDDSFTLAALLFYQKKKGGIKGFDAV